MSPGHDPVGAIVEAEATGRTAEIFCDIRATMRIPMVTAIWRSLDGIEGGLETVWAAVRPVIASGQAARVMQHMDQEIEFPTPQSKTPLDLNEADLTPSDLLEILAVLRAYNRANALSLIALTALARPTCAKGGLFEAESDPDGSVVTVLPPLLEREQISAACWSLLEQTTAIGAERPNPAVPTLWRHLIHWPGLISLATRRLLPLNANGSLFAAVRSVVEFVEAEAPKMGAGIDRDPQIPKAARTAVEGYIGEQPSVARMTTVGRSVELWLKSTAPQVRC